MKTFSSSAVQPELIADLVEQLWLDFEGRVPREKIQQIAREIALGYEGTTVTTYVPILLRRYVCERLKADFRFERNKIK